jgi:hypothetical protein
MLFSSGLSSFGFTYDNWGTNPSATIGTQVVPGTTNAYGNWTALASSANIAFDCYWMYLQVHTGAVSANAKNQMLQIGIDPAGGTAYGTFLTDFVMGESPSLAQAGAREHLFPIFIKAGSSVAAKVQGSHATAGTCYLVAKFYGKPSNPENVPAGMFSESIGSTASTTLGTAITPGNAADGSWASLGTTSKNLWWWQMGYQINNGTITAEYTFLELAFGDATNKVTIFRAMHGGTTTETCGLAAQTPLLVCAAYQPVPAGSNIYLRARTNNAPDTGYNAMALGIGG